MRKMQSALSNSTGLRVYLSVHLSITLQYCVKTAKHIVEILTPTGSTVILVFLHVCLYCLHLPVSFFFLCFLFI